MIRVKLLSLTLAAVMLASLLGGCAQPPAGGIGDSIDALGQAGVPVMEDVTSTAPIVALSGTPSAMRFTRWQLTNLVAEADAHNGYLASELDALGTPPPGSPAFSTILVAWLHQGDSPLAKYAARFVDIPDIHHTGMVVFPSLVVLSFIGDIARSKTISYAPPVFDLGRYIAAPASAAGIPGCDDVSQWVTNTTNAVYNALQSNGTGWLSNLWNSIVSVAGTAISTVAGTLASSITNFVARIFTIAATLMQVTAMLKPWTVKLANDPAAITLADSPVDGTFTATLDAPEIAWPQSLVACVQTFSNVDLSKPAWKDAPVTWTQAIGIPTIASKTQEDDTLKDDKTAAYDFKTTTAEHVAQSSCPQLVPEGNVGITVTVARRDIANVVSTLETAVTNELPSALKTYVLPYIQPAINDATSATNAFRAPSAHAVVRVSKYIETLPCSPASSEPATPTAQVTPGTHGHLEAGKCDDIATVADVGYAFRDGSKLITTYDTEQDERSLTGTHQIVQVWTTHQVPLTNICIIGKPSLTQPHQDDPTGGFDVIPDPYGQQPMPQSATCRQLMGADLDRLGAQCFYNDLNRLIVRDGTTEYISGGVPPADKTDNSASTPEDMSHALLLMEHILHREAGG